MGEVGAFLRSTFCRGVNSSHLKCKLQSKPEYTKQNKTKKIHKKTLVAFLVTGITTIACALFHYIIHELIPPLISADAPMYLKLFMLITSMMGQTTRDGSCMILRNNLSLLLKKISCLI